MGETLETLCAFLTTIGPAFDIKDWKFYDAFSACFQNVKELSTSKSVPARIRCLLKDVMDMRTNGWQKQRRAYNEPEGPMKMAEVQKQWQRDNAAKDKAMTGARGGGATPIGSGNSPAAVADDEWATVGKSGSRREIKSTPLSTPTGRGDRGAISLTPNAGSSNSFGALERGKPKMSSKSGKETTTEWRLKPSTPSAKGSLTGEIRSLAPSTSNSECSAAEFKKEAEKAISELAQSRDLEEALRRLKDLRLPSKHQKVEASHIIAQIVEQQNDARPTLWKFFVRLFLEDVMQTSALSEGLDRFMTEVYSELKCDVPKLPSIMREELLPVLEGESQLSLSPSELSKLKEQIEQA